MEISNIIIKENPHLWAEEFRQEIIRRSLEALQVEYQLIDWIFGDQDLDFVTREEVKAFIKSRMQMSLEAIGIKVDWISEEEQVLISKFDFFETKSKLMTKVDFFAYKETAYAKGTRSYDINSLFGEQFKAELEALNVYA